jgi:NAD(P)-dependent dehydrogenase (short-subunit alcohol dehydrogenase family)
MISLAGKVAIVTGGANGIGRAIAAAFTEAGAQVVVADIENAEFPRFVRADVSRPEDVRTVIDAAAEINGHIDVLCNNAAHLGDAHASLDATDEEWQRSIAVTLMGAQHFTRAVLPYMLRQRSGSIVNIASIQGIAAARDSVAYTSVKHGLIGFTRSVAYDYGPHGIRCNAICPGAIRTRISPAEGSELHQRQISKTFLGRTGLPVEVAAAALFLASDGASYITGVALPVDGGWSAM